MIFVGRFLLNIFPLIYMYLIWQQTSHFDPESVSDLRHVLNPYLILAIGAALELGHFFEFGILYFLLILAFLSFGHLKKWKEVLVLIFSISYGFLDEIHQLFVPFRSFSIVDLIKNAIGVFVIAILIHKNYFNSKESRFGQFLRSSTNFFKKGKSKVYF
ncbi:VanZ family protein [Neobacillus niacini]|uniref:VanZ family protein n=1 Tax=Neobacillus niacini TaxID=86668 RepID=UPI00285E9D3F|nr:VanZ family protein [Neobacillus niacini]MDR7079145.1 VanZ family protein [Neobacillus niacini]